MFSNQKIRPILKNGRFYNFPDEPKTGLKGYSYMLRSLLHEIYIFIVSLKNGKSRLPKNSDQWVDSCKIPIRSQRLLITWIGHASFLIQVGNINILTDPIFGDATFFFPRIFPAGIKIEDLPSIDYVIISHNHLDHMDSKSLIALKKLNPNISILVPYGDKIWFEKRNFSKVFEAVWWEDFVFDAMNKIKFTFLPAYHWSQRTLFDQNKSLWGSWMIECSGYKVYFAGDTAYSRHFENISKYFHHIDVALMPIGPCEPREKMCLSHINAEEAGRAFLDLGAKNFIPMHWGTYHFGTDNVDTPLNRIKIWWNNNQLNLISKFLHSLKIGQSIEFNLPQAQKIISQVNSQILSSSHPEN